MTDLEAIAKDAAERVHKNGGCVPQMAFAPILFALQDALRPAPVASGGQHSSATDFPPDDVLACVESQHSSGEVDEAFFAPFEAFRPKPPVTATARKTQEVGNPDLLDEIAKVVRTMKKGVVRKNSKSGVIVDIDATETLVVRGGELLEGATKALALRCQNDDRPRR